MKTREERLGVLHQLVLGQIQTTRPRTHQVAYLLQDAHHVPTGYSFRYQYAPISRELDNDLDLLKAMGYLKEEREPPTLQAAEEPIPEEWETGTRHYATEIKRALDTFSSKEDLELKLLATIHFFHTRHGRSRHPAPNREALIWTISKMMPKVDDQLISRQYNHLEELRLVEVSPRHRTSWHNALPSNCTRDTWPQANDPE